MAAKRPTSVITKFRHKFIFTNMLFVLIVLGVVFCTVGVVNYNQRVSEIYSALDHASALVKEGPATNGEVPSSDGQNMANDAAASGTAGTQAATTKGGKRESGEDQFVATSTYIVDSNGAVVKTLNDPLSLDSTTLSTAIEQALAATANAGTADARGTISTLNLYYRVTTSSTGRPWWPSLRAIMWTRPCSRSSKRWA